MIDRELVNILVCPENRTPLHLADEELLKTVNRAIRDGLARTRGGRPVETPLTAGLVREDMTLLYPVVDEIPILLVDEAIPLPQILNAQSTEQRPEGT